MVVATRGADGSVAATRDGRRYSAPAYPASIVSTLGAGDAFHGALLAALVEELPLDSALTYANTSTATIYRQFATAVPEPATWGMMILGFGLVGGSLRRRKTKVSFAL